MTIRTRLLRDFAVLGFIALSVPALAQNSNGWSNVGDVGGPLLWVAGAGSSLLQDGSAGKDHAARTVDALLVTFASTQLLQNLTHEPRPYDSGSHDSFPSDHAALSFAVAAAQSYYHPSQAPYWYGAATLISYARVAGNEHHPQDVIAGALLGYVIGEASVRSMHGWIIAPYYERGASGVMVSVSF